MKLCVHCFTHSSLTSEPLPPNGLNLDASNLDARDQTITLAWNGPSSGETSGYNIEILDGETRESYYQGGSNTQTDVNFILMKNGYNYTVKIWSRSQTFNGQNVVTSDAFETTFKTVVQSKLILSFQSENAFSY